MKRAAATTLLLVALASLLAGCPPRADRPRDVVAGFLAALNEKDWDGMTARLSRKAKARIPEDEQGRLFLRTRVFGLLETMGGRIRYEVVGENLEDERTASVPATIEVRPVGVARRDTVTFRLTYEDEAWKLLPEVVLPSGRVLEDPFEILGTGG